MDKQLLCTSHSRVDPVFDVLGHGGGWGYSAHSVEAIRFCADADILLGGLGLFGGRGEYTAKIKVSRLETFDFLAFHSMFISGFFFFITAAISELTFFVPRLTINP